MVTFIVALLGGIVMPKWGAAARRYQLDLAARRVSADLAAARSRAACGSAAVVVSFDTPNNRYQIVGMPDPDHGGAGTYTVSLATPPYNARIASAAFGNSSQVTFDGYGTPSAGGTVVITSGSGSRTLTMEAGTGTVTIQ